MTVLQTEYAKHRREGADHDDAVTQTAAKYGLTPDEVVRCLRRAEGVRATGLMPSRRNPAGRL